jgi:cyclohexyl-isocyanide hydratase
MEHLHGTSDHPLLDQMNQWRNLKQSAIMLLYPGMTALDLIGPQYVFASMMGMKLYLTAKTMSPILTDTGVIINPNSVFSDCPTESTIFFVPGGTMGTLAVIQDEETLAFVKKYGSNAEYVTSVCTGSLILGAAGLLKGYKATSHWMTRSLLAHCDGLPIDERVVVDRNRITGAGVTAGFDFALSLAARLRGQEFAQGLQLLAEYQPEPPFSSGTPNGAAPDLVRLLKEMMTPFLESMSEQLKKGNYGD